MRYKTRARSVLGTTVWVALSTVDSGNKISRLLIENSVLGCPTLGVAVRHSSRVCPSTSFFSVRGPSSGYSSAARSGIS